MGVKWLIIVRTMTKHHLKSRKLVNLPNLFFFIIDWNLDELNKGRDISMIPRLNNILVINTYRSKEYCAF